MGAYSCGDSQGSQQISRDKGLVFTYSGGLPVFHLFCRTRGDRQGGQGDVVYPIGYSEKPVPDTSIQETDKNLVEKVSTLKTKTQLQVNSTQLY